MLTAPPAPRTTADERETFARFITDRGLKLTRQREAILDVFVEADKHIDVEELFRRVKDRAPGIGHATVYRTMKLLLEAGLAQEHNFGDGVTRYERTARKKHHDHLICSQCNLIMEFSNQEIEELQEQIAARLGFRILEHKLEIYGDCQGEHARCPQKELRHKGAMAPLA